MPKAKTRYVCFGLRSAQPKWQGKCPDCGEWNTLVDPVIQEPAPGRPGSASIAAGDVGPLSLPDIPADGYERIPVSIDELSRVLGGGIVPGSVVLISGDPGIGKSTLLIQLCAAVRRNRGAVLYVSGEECGPCRSSRARAAGHRPAEHPGAGGHAPGEHRRTHQENAAQAGRRGLGAEHLFRRHPVRVGQRDSGARLLGAPAAPGQIADLPALPGGPRDQEGAIAGPRILEHMVDTVLYLEGERFHSFRLLRSVKNRFGSTNEVGVFEMAERGWLR